MAEQRKKRSTPTNTPVPKKVELYQDLLWVWIAFEHLSRRRTYTTVGPESISLSEILAYVKLTDITGNDTIDRFLRFMTAMDDLYISEINKMLDQQRKREESRNKNRKA